MLSRLTTTSVLTIRPGMVIVIPGERPMKVARVDSSTSFTVRPFRWYERLWVFLNPADGDATRWMR